LQIIQTYRHVIYNRHLYFLTRRSSSLPEAKQTQASWWNTKAAWHVSSGLWCYGVPGVKKVHPPWPGRKELPRWRK